ncbi:MAG: right-handed parallel beta-helix repeat-containing protein [Candidatus Hatepunaea meridiana]|nr:right-handed parallel beta-helix repeat-containing protein [Candidatus Hatepunaea meridiana]
MRIFNPLILLLILFLFTASNLNARIINVPDDQETIQAGIDASMDGDTVLVQPEIYVENINFNGRNIVVGSLFLTEGDEDFISETIIDGDANDRSVVVFRMGETATLIGFTIQNGITDYGGGIYCRGANPTLSHLIVTNNIVERNGGGIYCTGGSDPTIDNVVINRNSCGYVGGGFGCYGESTPTLTNCIIVNNYSDHCGGGIHGYDSELTLTNLTVTGNEALHTGGAIYLTADATAHAVDCIFWENIPHEVYLMPGMEGGTIIGFSHSVVDGGIEEIDFWQGAEVIWGAGNIDLDPEFVNPERYDYSLSEDSPCIDGGNPESQFDPDGTRADMGADYFHNEDGQHVLHVPDAFETIQEAIDEADDGDIVLVQPGEYVENVNFDGKELILGSRFLSTDEKEFIVETIIDGNENGSVITFENDEGEDAMIIGFSVNNGRAVHGGGISIQEASPSIHNLIISQNHSTHDGGGIYCINNSNPSISDCIITDNFAEDEGGGIKIANNSEPAITHCAIFGNSTEGYGGGINSSSGSNPIITFCTLSNNSGEIGGGGISCSNNANPNILNSILWNDTPEEIYFSEEGQANSIAITHTDVQNGEDGIETNDNGEVNWGEGNININPLFANPDNDDYHLTENSPCIDAGDPESPRDPDNTQADMGVYYFHQAVPRDNIVINVPDDYETIQEAIDVSIDGDSILVSPGRYEENINFRGIEIRLGSLYMRTGNAEYIETTIIDGRGEGAVVTFNSREGNQTKLKGFTITNGSSRECGGIYCFNSGPTIEHCVIYGNSAEEGGGGGIFCYASDPVIRNCTITNNSVEEGGGGLYGWSGAGPSLINTIFWDNNPNQICFGEGRDRNTMNVSYSDIEGGEDEIVTNWNVDIDWRDGNIDEDPLFVNIDENDYNLTEDSPCIDAGDQFSPDDPDETRADMGAFYFEQHPGWLEFSITLNPGWNLISSPVQPPEPNMWVVWAELIERGNLLWVKDHFGRFLMTEFDYSNMEDWDVHYGYYVKVREDDEKVLFNLPVEWDEPIELNEGWSIAAYFPEEEVEARQAFAEIEDVLLLAKDGEGRFLSTQYGFCNMIPLRRGQGYQVCVTEPVDLVWCVPEQQAMSAPSVRQNPLPVHFTPSAPTSRNMSVIIQVDATLLSRGLTAGRDATATNQTELGAFNTQGLCVGAMVINEDTPYGIAIWGDDPSTKEIEGMQENEHIIFKLWNGEEEITLKLTGENNQVFYSTDALAAISLHQNNNIPSEFSLSAPFPNPFNNVTNISYALPVQSYVLLNVYDIAGRSVATLVNEEQSTGYYTTQWNSQSASTGVYFVKMEAEEFNDVMKVVLVK